MKGTADSSDARGIDAQSRLTGVSEMEWIGEPAGDAGGAKAPPRFAAPEHPLMFLNRTGSTRGRLGPQERDRMRRWVRRLLSEG